MKSAESTALYPILDYPDSLEAPGDLPPLDALDALFRNTVEQAPVGIAFASRDGSYRYCNKTFCAMLGFAPEELNDASIAGLTLSEDPRSPPWASSVSGGGRLGTSMSRS